MRKIIILIVILAVSVSLFFVFSTLFEKETIKIGVLEELNIEKETRREAFKGMELFVDEINKRGGVNGMDIELIRIGEIAIDQEIPFQPLEEVERLHKPLLYISVGSNVPEFVADFAEEHKVPYFTIASARDFTEGRDWVFRHGVAFQSYLSTTGAIFHLRDTQGVGIISNADLFFSRLYPTLTGDMFGRPQMSFENQSFYDVDTDYTEQILALLDNDFFYIGVKDPSKAEKIVKQLRELKYQGDIFTVELFADPFSDEIADFDGIYSSATLVHKSDFLFAEELRNRFEEKYGTSLLSFFNEHAAEGYDIMRLISELLEDQESTRENLKNTLDQGFHYDSIFGNTVLEPGGHFIEIDFYSVRYKDGELEYLQ